jgi:hypothetical protein
MERARVLRAFFIIKFFVACPRLLPHKLPRIGVRLDGTRQSAHMPLRAQTNAAILHAGGATVNMACAQEGPCSGCSSL